MGVIYSSCQGKNRNWRAFSRSSLVSLEGQALSSRSRVRLARTQEETLKVLLVPSREVRCAGEVRLLGSPVLASRTEREGGRAGYIALPRALGGELPLACLPGLLSSSVPRILITCPVFHCPGAQYPHPHHLPRLSLTQTKVQKAFTAISPGFRPLFQLCDEFGFGKCNS